MQVVHSVRGHTSGVLRGYVRGRASGIPRKL